MGLSDGFKKGFDRISTLTSSKPNPREQAYVDGFRPVEQNPFSSFSSDAAKLPNIPLGFKFCFDLYNFNDVVRTIVRTLVGETFRNGVSVKERFACKCNECGYEYDAVVEKCKSCGNDRSNEKGKGFRLPDQDQKRDLLNLMKEVNLNDETLIDVLSAVAVDVNVIDNAFLVARKKYGFGADGKVLEAKVVEILRGSPIALKLVQNIQGRYGRTDDNNYVMFCLDHRTEKYELSIDDIETHHKDRCPKCGLQMYPAYYVYDQTGYVTPVRSALSRIYFTKGEIIHFKKFSHGIGYGFPPILSIWAKALILMKMDYFILQAYNLQRPPKGVLVMKGTRESLQKAWDKAKDEARMNPHMIYPIIVEPTDDTDTKTVAEWVDFSYKSTDVDMIEYRNELRRSIGALWQVSPIFQADSSTGVGLANEGLQLTVTTRAVETEQKLFNDKVLEWLVRQFGIDDWKIVLNQSEESDKSAQLQRESMRIDIAMKLKEGFGSRPKPKHGEDGIEFEYEEPLAIDKLIVEIRSFAAANGLPLDDETIRAFLSGQQSNIMAEQYPYGMVGSEISGASRRKFGVHQDGRGNDKPANNPTGNNKKNPLNEGDKTQGEIAGKTDGAPDSGRPRKDRQRFQGEPTGIRNDNN